MSECKKIENKKSLSKEKIKKEKILFVCTGNTCRSPMAQAVCKSYLKKEKNHCFLVQSAGIFKEKNSSLSNEAEKVLLENGLTLGKFKPRQLKQKMVEDACLVVCMTQWQKELLRGCGEIVSIQEIFGCSIPDPYGLGEEVYRTAFYKLLEAMPSIVECAMKKIK